MKQKCAHCGLPMRGYATVNGQSVCHHPALDCYRLVTVYGERLGLRKPPLSRRERALVHWCGFRRGFLSAFGIPVAHHTKRCPLAGFVHECRDHDRRGLL